MKKRILQFGMTTKAMTIGLLLVIMGITNLFAQNFTVGNLNYSVNEDDISVAVRSHVDGTSASGELFIPEMITYNGVSYSVTSIRNNAFNGCSGLIGSLVIPNSISNIGEYAFKNCSGLNGSLTIGTGVTSIDEEAFANTGFVTVNFNPTNCSKMGYRREDGDWEGSPVFKDCPTITTLIIGENVTKIPTYAFENCSGLTGNLNIPNSVISIGFGAFYQCSGINGILTIGNSVSSIGGHAFFLCNNIVGINFNAVNCSDGAEGYSIFTLHDAFLTFGEGVIRIPGLVFTGNSTITDAFSGNLTIPNSVTVIGDNAFGAAGFSNGILTIGSSVQNMGRAAFSYCHFSEIYYNATCCSGVSLGYQNTAPFKGCSAELTIGENVVSIPNNMFRDSNNGVITGNLIIPNSVKTIGDYAFAGNRSLTGNLVLSDSLVSIGDYAFYGCYYLNGDYSIPNTVTSVGENAFQGTGWYNQQPDGVLYLDNWCLGYKNSIPSGILVFEEGTKGIANGAFRNYTGLTGDLTIPNTVNRLPKNVFNGCTGLNGILTIPSSIDLIGEGAFTGCNHLTTVYYDASNCADVFQSYNNLPFKNCSGHLVIGSNVESVPKYIFCDSNFNGDLVMANSVTFIGYGAFYNCNSISALYYNGSIDQWCNIVFNGYGSNPLQYAHNLYIDNALVTEMIIPESVTSIKDYAFMGGTCISSFTIPNTVTNIGDLAFCNCSNFFSITIPTSVLSIGSGAFENTGWYNDQPNGILYLDGCCLGYKGSSPSGKLIIAEGTRLIASQSFSFCNRLTSLLIPNTVNIIGDNAFEYCPNLTDVTILRTTPPSLGTYGFHNTSCPIYVPYESIIVYKTANNWNEYENQLFPMSYITIPSYIENEGNWHFIASPLLENIDPLTVDNMITETEYDLYQFNLTGENGEWENHKADNYNLVNGKGYLYANAGKVNIIFKGEFNENETQEEELVYNEDNPNAGWNLVGNPFPISAYISKPYYVMNEDGTDINPEPIPATVPVPACTAVFVKATVAGDTVVFTVTAP